MFGRKLKRQKTDEPIEARTLNRPIEAIERADNLRVAPPLAMARTPSGPFIYYTGPLTIWAKITSGTLTGPYAWTQQIEKSAGTWADGWMSGTTLVNPAYNRLGVTPASLPVIVELTFTVARDWRFSFGSC